MLLGAATLSLCALAGTAAAAPASSMSSGTGWMRCAHLSPTNPVDIYLYSFGDPMAMDVLRHVPYGGVGMYMKMPPVSTRSAYDELARRPALRRCCPPT